MAGALEQVGDGVWRYAGDLKRAMNVYFIEDEGGVTQFDAGTKGMTKHVARAAAELGGLTRVVLGHSHPDHRGTAPGLRVPVLCHPDEVADAEADGGYHYFDIDRIPLWWSRLIYPRLLKHWDGGPVRIADTVTEGDRVGEFEVVHLPGHAPGLIALWRERDRLALASDCFYMVDVMSGRQIPPRVPHPAFNEDEQRAREAIRRLAALDPATAWPGHHGPLTGDVRSRLERVAAD
jgi:hydroxyacylglutathione hydrolase